MFPMNRNFILLFCLLFTGLSYALPEDNKAKLIIIADRSTYNYKTGIKVFEGNVKVDQGTTHLTADKLITRDNEQHKIEEATAFGLQGLAHYWTLPKPNDPEIHAQAKVIKFFPIAANVTLEQEVYVQQGKNSFQGQLILYNMNDQTITVPASDSGRAVLVYNPEK